MLTSLLGALPNTEYFLFAAVVQWSMCTVPLLNTSQCCNSLCSMVSLTNYKLAALYSRALVIIHDSCRYYGHCRLLNTASHYDFCASECCLVSCLLVSAEPQMMAGSAVMRKWGCSLPMQQHPSHTLFARSRRVRRDVTLPPPATNVISTWLRRCVRAALLFWPVSTQPSREVFVAWLSCSNSYRCVSPQWQWVAAMRLFESSLSSASAASACEFHSLGQVFCWMYCTVDPDIFLSGFISESFIRWRSSLK